MRQSTLWLLFLCCALRAFGGPPDAPVHTGWDRVRVAPMKAPLFPGHVTLTTGLFVRQGSTLSAIYEAKVVPWFFLSEGGRISIFLSDATLASLVKGERATFTGEAVSHSANTRVVTGQARPTDRDSGNIEVTIEVGGTDLVFSSTYRLDPP
jgi:hypothetical protein